MGSASSSKMEATSSAVILMNPRYYRYNFEAGGLSLSYGNFMSAGRAGRRANRRVFRIHVCAGDADEGSRARGKKPLASAGQAMSIDCERQPQRSGLADW